ncbi:MAG: 6-pyruvoyl tetrahydropterin synthase family protein [Candidatus Competibacterales bacterium]
MYSVAVRDHLMIAHSFRGEVFGPAQSLHGATYLVDVELQRPTLDPDGIVVDIGKLHEVLKQVLAEFNFKNLDDLEVFKGQNTTTEYMAKVVFDRLKGRLTAGELGPHSQGIEQLRVTLHESHVAWARFEGPV